MSEFAGLTCIEVERSIKESIHVNAITVKTHILSAMCVENTLGSWNGGP